MSRCEPRSMLHLPASWSQWVIVIMAEKSPYVAMRCQRWSKYGPSTWRRRRMQRWVKSAHIEAESVVMGSFFMRPWPSVGIGCHTSPPYHVGTSATRRACCAQCLAPWVSLMLVVGKGDFLFVCYIVGPLHSQVDRGSLLWEGCQQYIGVQPKENIPIWSIMYARVIFWCFWLFNCCFPRTKLISIFHLSTKIKLWERAVARKRRVRSTRL